MLVAVSFCGCRGYRETETGYIVTTLGFDGTEEEFTISAEVVSAGGSEISNEPYSEILTSKGKSPGNAVFTLNDEISKSLILDHCNAIVLGENLTGKQIGEIFEYINGVKELNYGIYVTVSDNVQKLLKNTKSVSVARGFDIAGNIKESVTETGIDFHNRFYEVFRAYKEGETYSFPYLKEEDKKIIIYGENVYKNKIKKASLNTEESLIYSFLQDDNSGGRVYISKEYAEINHISSENQKNHTKIIEMYFKNKSENFDSTFEKKTEEFIDKHGKDLEIAVKKVKIKARKDF